MKQTIEVRWKRGSAARWTDVFNVEEFEKRLEGAERAHLVRGPRGAEYDARFRLNVTDREATLDYDAFAAYNKRQGMERGVMRIQFSDNRHTRVASLWWKDKLMSARDCDIATKRVSGPTSPGELPIGQRRRQAEVLLRPGQADFRRLLGRMYGSKCCISGCTVALALEAAHVERYADTQSDRPSNGLLLRRDLHALFDADHLAIDPKSREVHLSPEALEWPAYAELHRKKLSAPQPGYTEDGPTSAPLRKRWTQFVKDHRL